MTMTDPIADMLTRIRNANVAMHDTVRMPALEAEAALATDPRARGLHRGLQRPDRPGAPGEVLEIQMKYTAERARAIAGIRSACPTPGLRVYVPRRPAAAGPRWPRASRCSRRARD